MAWPKGKPRKPAREPIELLPFNPPENSGESVAKSVSFGAVRLLDEVGKLRGNVGEWSANTSYFRASAGYSVSLDVDASLVTIRHETSGAAIVVPIGRVMHFEPLPPPKAEDAPDAK